MRFSLVNLQVLFYALLKHAVVANVVALALGTTLFLGWLALCLQHEKLDSLLMLSAVLLISLLPVYHRLYDAFLLIFPVCWAMKALSASHKRVAVLALALTGVFLVPGPSVFESLAEGGQIPHQLSDAWTWNALLMTHQIWALLILVLILLVTAFKQTKFQTTVRLDWLVRR